MPKQNIDIILSIVAISLFFLLLIATSFILFRIYLKRKSKLILEKGLMKTEFEKTILRTQLEIQEQTFTYVSKEIHDNISQVLSLVRLNLNTLESDHEKVKLALMDELMEKAMSDLRNLSHSLDSDDIRSNGWTGAVQKLVRNVTRTGKHRISFGMQHDLPTLEGDKPILLFRMIQETINNILKHASASNIIIDASGNGTGLRITIKDDGIGFDPETVTQGAGLRNLHLRAKMIGAQLHFKSELNEGTNITIAVNTNHHE